MTTHPTHLTAGASRPPLETALKLDAVVTGAVGVAYLAAAGPLGDLLGLDAAPLRAIGAFLAVFAAGVWFATRPAARVVVGANCLWVAASLVFAVAGWGSPTTLGTLWVVAQAIVVAALAELQFTALRRPAL